ncbi:MAG: hypothetical protein IKZ99_08840 [Salinivirgaceae bacterium]|nr:hypothetical protein [Salinivirgaceae bacterium]
MDTQKLFDELKMNNISKSISLQLKQLFFSKKTEEILEKYNRVHLTLEQGYYISGCFVANIPQLLPEAEVIQNKYSKFNEPKWIKMKNIDFEMCSPKFLSAYCSFSYMDFYKINDIADVMREIDNAVPEWEAEFQTFCTKNQQKIKDLDTKRLLFGSNISNVAINYAVSKVRETAFMHRRLLPNMCESVYKALENKAIKKKERTLIFQNCRIDFGTDEAIQIGKLKVYFTNYSGFCGIDLCSPEVLLEIDRNILQWIYEGKELEREFDKREKIKQINENSTKVLVKNKMRELGCEYRLADKDKGQSYYYKQSEKPKEYELAIKLQKGRKLVVTIPTANLDRVRKILDSLSASINAINSVPMNHRIKFQFAGNEAWLKE